MQSAPTTDTPESIAEANALFRRLGIMTRHRLLPDGGCESFEADAAYLEAERGDQ
jgi:hypothetical protein